MAHVGCATANRGGLGGGVARREAEEARRRRPIEAWDGEERERRSEGPDRESGREGRWWRTSGGDREDGRKEEGANRLIWMLLVEAKLFTGFEIQIGTLSLSSYQHDSFERFFFYKKTRFF